MRTADFRIALGLCFLSLALPVPVQAQDGSVTEFYHDFRGRPLPPELKLFQVDDPGFTKQEDAGLRIRIPKTHEDQPYRHPSNGVGCQTSALIRGDFEVTATVEFVDVERPSAGGGAGFGLSVGAGASGVQLRRVIGANGGENLVSAWFFPGTTKRTEWKRHRTPCVESSVKLRMKRLGATVHYQWAPAAGGAEFDEIHQFDLGKQDMKRVCLFAFNNGNPGLVDVRFIDLRVSSPGQAAAVPVPVAAPAQGAPQRETNVWLIAGLVASLAIVFVLAVLGAWLYRRKRRSDQGETAATSVSFACPGCERGLKINANLAGKKVQCAQCGTAVVVPSVHSDIG